MGTVKHLDLNLLRVFDTLMDERSVSRAAERLSVSQPAVSGMLTRLRDSLGDPLFIRGQYGMVPTERALELALPIKSALENIDHILAPVAFDPKTAEMTLTIAATDYALQVILTPFLMLLANQAPGIRVAVTTIEPTKMADQLERGQIDFAFTTPDEAPPTARAKPLFYEDYVFVVRKNHSVITGDHIDIDDFCAVDHGLVSFAGNPFHGVTDDALRSMGKKRRVVASMPSFLALISLLQTTDLGAVVPKRLVTDNPALRPVDLPFELQGFTKVLVWHERTHQHPAYEWVRRLLASVC